MIILLFFSYKILSNRNKIIDLNIKNVHYIELIKSDNNEDVIVRNKKNINSIISLISKIKGKKTNRISQEDETSDFIKIYQNKKKIELIKTNKFLKINNQWYLLSNESNEIINKIFNENELK